VDVSRFAVVERGGLERRALPVQVDPKDGHVRFVPRSLAGDSRRDDDPGRLTMFDVNDGIAGPLEIYAYDLGSRGFRIVGLVRPSATRSASAR
jgi:hypothetical protein